MTDLSHLDDSRPFVAGPGFLDAVGRRARSLRRRRRVVRGAAGGAFALVAAVGVLVAAWRPDTVDVVTPGDGRDDVVTVLIAGTDTCTGDPCPDDTRSGDGGFADTLMLVRARPADGTIDVVSLPRDLWVPPGDLGGTDGRKVSALDTTQRLAYLAERFGLGVDHYVELDMTGLVELVDAVGGVDLDVAEPVTDQGSGLRVDRAGCQPFDGRRLLALLRSRHLRFGDGRTDPTGDLGRVARQQQVVDAVLRRMAADPDAGGRLPKLVAAVIDHARVDPSLDVATLVGWGRELLAADALEVRVGTLPVTPGGTETQAWLTSDAADPWASLGAGSTSPLVETCP